jgi:hypothetical protein
LTNFVGAFLISLCIFPLTVQAGEEFKLLSALVGKGGNIWLPSTLIV